MYIRTQLVSATMASGHRKETTGVTIVSEVGRPVALRPPWDCAEISVVATPGGGVVATQRVGAAIAWDTEPGVSYGVACGRLPN